MPDPWAGFSDPGSSPAPAAVQADPWAGFKDAGPRTEAISAADEGSFLHPKKPTGTGLAAVGKRILQYPGLIAGTVLDALKLPGEVYQGKVDPMSPEGRERALDLASLVVPDKFVAPRGAAAAAAKPAEISPNVRAAETAAELDAPLPRGVVSESPVIQATTQAARNLPLVGPKIDAAIGATGRAAGEAVNEMAGNLSGGVPDRATAGATLRPSLQGVIDDNNLKIDRAYTALRRIIDPEKVTPLPKTQAALKGILGERTAAGMVKPESGLADVMNLADSGASFNGLVRARNDVGKIVGLAATNPNPGFNVGDFKRIYAAMSGDMENVVRRNARIDRDKASNSLRYANQAADVLVDRNKNVQRLLNVQSDERLVGSVINAAQNKTGNARVLMQLRRQMPKEDFEQISGVALSELGHNPATGEFSLNKFATGWDKLGDSAKGILFADPNHRGFIDRIAQLGKTLKDTSKYENTSKTGHTAAMAGVIGALGSAAMSGEITHVLGVLGGLGGGYVMAKALARPATAASVAKWIDAAQRQRLRPSTAGNAALSIATRNMIGNMSAVPGFIGRELAQRIKTPAGDGNEGQQKKNPGVVYKDRRKIPDRYPQ